MSTGSTPGEGETPVLPMRVEIIPTTGIVDALLAQLPAGTTVTVTCLPHHGVERTMAVAVELADHGYNAVPHLAARAVESRQQLAGMVRSCTAGGITEIFAIGGDKQPAGGPFASSAALMKELAELSAGSLSMGVGGYPKGTPPSTMRS